MSAEVPTSTSRLPDALVAAALADVFGSKEELQSDCAGDRIGPYHLVEPLGEGGFGIVWRAQQHEPVEREVAVKLIKLGMDSREVLTRFEHERQVLASMVHPHIATLLDSAITQDGRPCFVMELVKGPPVTVYSSGRRLPLRERLELFIQICLGVHHAHQKGVIHRDIKPSNILVTEVDGAPVPKIIDFGIAKALTPGKPGSQLWVTRSDVVIGSPLYMSPEQLNDPSMVDTRCDIYALGVLLYELLTEQPPFDVTKLANSTSEEMRRFISTVVPMKPSHRSKAAEPIPTDLDWIALRALEKDPARRYASAAEFAADVRRHLADEPVIACPPSYSYQISCWVRRHRRLFVATLISVISLLAGTALALWQAHQARAAQQLAEAQALRAQAAETAAEVGETRAKRAAELLSQLLDDAAEDIGKGHNPEVLKRSLERCESAVNELSDDPTLQRDLIEHLANLQSKTGDHTAQIRLLRRHAELIAQVGGADNEASWRAELAYLHQQSDFGARATVPPQLKQLLQRIEANGQRGSLIWFTVHRELVRTWVKLDATDEALRLSEEGLEESRRQKVVGLSLSTTLIKHASVLIAAEQFEAAEAALLEARKIIHARGNDATRMSNIDKQMLDLFSQQKAFTRAADYARERLAEVRSKKASLANQVRWLLQLASFESKARQSSQALSDGRAALDLVRSLVAARNKDTKADSHRELLGQALRNLSEIKSLAGLHDEAIEHALEASSLAHEQGNPMLKATALASLADSYRSAKRWEEAYQTYWQRYELRKSQTTSYRVPTEDLRDMALIRLEQKRPDEALAIARQFWAIIAASEEAKSDFSHVGELASIALKCWQETQAISPQTKPPPELQAWQAAKHASDKEDAKQSSASSPKTTVP